MPKDHKTKPPAHDLPLWGQWRDFPDYIFDITKTIWEDRNIHTLNDLYSRDIIVRSPMSVVVGNREVIDQTQATLAVFPDRQLLGEDVIWSKSSSDEYLSSHRIFSTATHNKPGNFGPPTGKLLQYRVIADCAAKDAVINDEWLIRDQGAIVRQIGSDPKTFAASLIDGEGRSELCSRPLTPATDPKGPYQSRGVSTEHSERYVSLLQSLMGADFSAIPSHYDRACHLEHPGGFTRHGLQSADAFWLGLRSSFPSAQFSIDHQIGRLDPNMPPRVALRWSLHGKHDGWGSFGPPSHANVYVLGISHAEFGPRGLTREWVLFDEVAIWKQILSQQG